MRPTFAISATTLALILACTGDAATIGAPPSDTPPATEVSPLATAPPSADPVVGSAGGEASSGPVATLCGSEPVIFGCPRSNGKALAVCGGPGRIQYRFGPPNAPEMMFPADPAQGPAEMVLTAVSYAQSMGHVLKFQSGNVRFEVTSMIGGGGGPDAESNNFQGVYLYDGEKLVDTVPCQGDTIGELESAKAILPLQTP